MFCEEIALPLCDVQILDRQKYSWEVHVEKKACKDEEGVQRYFKRMGILLFLCYLMNVNDMHGENIIAYVEYPIPIDLETLPGYRNYQECHNPEQFINQKLKNSVLSTGILPVVIWGEKGEGIILNALHKRGKIQTPFRMPMVSNPESSEIHIEYRKSERELCGSLPVLRGEAVDPVDYIQNLCEGFQRAYLLFLKKKTYYVKSFESLFTYESRYLVRHTQQYHMYLQASFYSDFLYV